MLHCIDLYSNCTSVSQTVRLIVITKMQDVTTFNDGSIADNKASKLEHFHCGQQLKRNSVKWSVSFGLNYNQDALEFPFTKLISKFKGPKHSSPALCESLVAQINNSFMTRPQSISSKRTIDGSSAENLISCNISRFRFAIQIKLMTIHDLTKRLTFISIN